MAERPSGPAAPAISPRLSLRAGLILGGIILAVAALDLAFFYSRGLTNLYGDAIAHMEGARRLTDSLTPGYQEIGTVWLPLFHLLAAPLAMNDALWRSGLAGSFVSLAAFVLTAWALFRLGLEMNGSVEAGIAALGGLLLCPSMLYLATTPLTEPLTLLWAVATVYGLFRYQQTGGRRALVLASLAAFLGTLTRYDGWFLLPFAAVFVFLARRESFRERFYHTLLFSLIAGVGPVLWFVHNAVRFGNPLEFYNGPYSAQAIYARQLATTGFRYPTAGSWFLSARYYLADLSLVIGIWPLEFAVLGLAAWALSVRERARHAAALLFLVPFIFYVQSMAGAAIPIYVPTLFPVTYYNLRYGIEMLPAVALFPSFLISSRLSGRARVGFLIVILGILAAQAVSMFSAGAREMPVVKESILNTPCRTPRAQAVTAFMREHYDGGRILMGSGKWPCLMRDMDIPYRQTVSDANQTIWKDIPKNPKAWVTWILRGEGDPVDEMMHAYPEAFKDYTLRTRIAVPQEGDVAIYRLASR